jgi:CheY-like chemotaxis protein
MNRKAGSLTLQQFGCEVTLAGTGKEAVEMVDVQPHFDLTCMYMNMPVMNGIEAAEAIRDLDHPNATTRILAMTGMAFEEDKQRCLESGMDDVVTKPFDINNLRDRVHLLKNPDSEDLTLSS